MIEFTDFLCYTLCNQSDYDESRSERICCNEKINKNHHIGCADPDVHSDGNRRNLHGYRTGIINTAFGFHTTEAAHAIKRNKRDTAKCAMSLCFLLS